MEDADGKLTARGFRDMQEAVDEANKEDAEREAKEKGEGLACQPPPVAPPGVSEECEEAQAQMQKEYMDLPAEEREGGCLIV